MTLGIITNHRTRGILCLITRIVLLQRVAYSFIREPDLKITHAIRMSASFREKPFVVVDIIEVIRNFACSHIRIFVVIFTISRQYHSQSFGIFEHGTKEDQIISRLFVKDLVARYKQA